MRMVTVKALQARHDIFLTEIFVAAQTPFTRDHLWCLFAEIMTVKTGKSLHAQTMDHPVCVTFRTCLLVWYEFMEIAEMAF